VLPPSTVGRTNVKFKVAIAYGRIFGLKSGTSAFVKGDEDNLATVDCGSTLPLTRTGEVINSGVHLSVAIKLENPKSPITPLAPSR